MHSVGVRATSRTAESSIAKDALGFYKGEILRLIILIDAVPRELFRGRRYASCME